MLGIPNLASVHCRLMLLAGKQPPCMETHGPHVRGFTYDDIRYFLEDGGYFRVDWYAGSGFYSLLPGTGGLMAKLFPRGSVTLVIALKRTDKEGLFIENLNQCGYETNFYSGNKDESNMYRV